ncbi:uncharacterized protein M6B38_147235 [Iris pallida]|uniref:Uncharacterized protein n=1 Tax=Iris pallida TaxID=29817 RepID=A0AAX6F979_IRIPA|nr:uncharacterized protein M6B38_147235 [Iris pallida]
MASLSTSLTSKPHLQFLRSSSPGFPVKKPSEQHFLPNFVSGSNSLSIRSSRKRKPDGLASRRQISVQCAYSEGERPSSAGIFIGGFVLGGLIVGTLGCVYAPQISRTLAGADKKDLMRKLPKFIYDEEKALEKTRKILTEKIAQLNSAIDDVSSQLRADDDDLNGAAVASDEVEAKS